MRTIVTFIIIALVLTVGAIEGKSIKDCVQLGNSLSKCKQIMGVN